MMKRIARSSVPWTICDHANMHLPPAIEKELEDKRIARKVKAAGQLAYNPPTPGRRNYPS